MSTAKSSLTPEPEVLINEQDGAILYRPPASWKTDHRTRRYITLEERQFSRENDVEMLRRSVRWLLNRQDERGSFHSDEEYRQGDRIDDQLGACAMLSFWLSLKGPDPEIAAALERGVRFHLDFLVHRTTAHPYPYSRYEFDNDSAYDLPNNLWVLWGGAQTLTFGVPFLSAQTTAELRNLLGQTWQLVSTNPNRGENPCHNQLLAFCEIGILYSRAVGNDEIGQQVLAYYHQRLRKLRVHDRGHCIYAEFNQWDANYGLLSWMSLEHLFTLTGDPALAEDADEMALYFNEMVSAGGYYWGGSRYNEGGVEEFLHLPASRALELGLDRMLLPEPANLWNRLVLDGHYGRVLLLRMDTAIRKPNAIRDLPPTPWSFRQGQVSLALNRDFRPHLVSAAGLEIIPAASPQGDGNGVVWRQRGTWKRDLLQLRPPPASEGLPYAGSEPIQTRDAQGVCSFHRGLLIETRQWWISTGKSLLWVGHVYSHSGIECEKLDFIVGNPVLTRLARQAVPVTEVESAEGERADTQGDAMAVRTRDYLRFGDVFVGATAPLEFVRPAREAFHTFPLPKQIYPTEIPSSNELRLHLTEAPGKIECRQSLFFALEIGADRPALSCADTAEGWNVDSGAGSFAAFFEKGMWSYRFNGEPLPRIGFGFDPSVHLPGENGAIANGHNGCKVG